MIAERILAAATALEGQAIGLRDLIATRATLPANRWPSWNIEWNRGQLTHLRDGYRILKWLAANPQEVPAGLATYIEGMGQ